MLKLLLLIPESVALKTHLSLFLQNVHREENQSIILYPPPCVMGLMNPRQKFSQTTARGL